jgi:hypothetical protein
MSVALLDLTPLAVVDLTPLAVVAVIVAVCAECSSSTCDCCVQSCGAESSQPKAVRRRAGVGESTSVVVNVALDHPRLEPRASLLDPRPHAA